MAILRPNLLIYALFLLLLPACSAENGSRTGAKAALYPNYDPAQAALFKDNFGPGAFNPDHSLPPNREEQEKIDLRARHADSVYVAKIVTVTEDRNDVGRSFQLELRPLERLRGTPPDKLSLKIPQGSPSFPLVREWRSELVGRRLIVFSRHFNDKGKATVHWYAESDSQAVRTLLGVKP